MTEKSNGRAALFAALLLLSSAFGFAAFLVGRAMYGEYLRKKNN